MTKLFSLLILLACSFEGLTQQHMRTIEELINTKDPGWPLVQKWIADAKNKIEVLPCDSLRAQQALVSTQVTTRSPMGAIIYNTGGLLVDDGWLRILGSGHIRLNRSLPEWNKDKSIQNYGETPGFLLVADDAAGGFFAINGGALGKDAGKVYYLSPDNLEWEALDLSYTDFLLFCFNGNLSSFYENLRWKGWENEVRTLDGNKVYNFFPMLFTKEGHNINKASRKAIPVEEQYSLNIILRQQLGIK